MVIHSTFIELVFTRGFLYINKQKVLSLVRTIGMDLNFVPCLAWVCKGVAKARPDQLQLSAEELKSLIEETKQEAGSDYINDDISDEDSHNVNGETLPAVKNEINDKSLSVIKNDINDKDFDAEYDLDTYDDDDTRPFMNITDVAVYGDNKEDAYITECNIISEDEEEEENFLIKDTDNLLIVGHVHDESSVLEIYVHNQIEDSLYVHHDIVLPSYPLALEWLNFDPADDMPGNFVAVGDMSPVIKIWDLDVVDILESDYCLGEKKKKKKDSGEKPNMKCHTDAVLSLSWNRHVKYLLASGSADFSVILWDLEHGVAIKKLRYHANKVQALQWHPTDGSLLLSGDTDGVIKLYDYQADTEKNSWTVDGEVEKVTWNLYDTSKFFCSTDTGFVYCFDMGNDEAEDSIQVHEEGITGLDMCPEHPNILLTASMDKTVKLWKVENGFNLIKTQNLKVGSIYTAKFAPDSGLTVAVGGNNASNCLKVMDLTDKPKASNPIDDNTVTPSGIHSIPEYLDTLVPPKKNSKKFKIQSGQTLWNKPGSSYNISDRSKPKKFKCVKKK